MIYKSPRYCLSIFQSIFLSVRKKFKIDILGGGHLGFLIRTNLAFFDFQIAKVLPTKFRVNWPFSSEEMQKRFLRFYIFDLQVTLMLSTKLRVKWPFGSGEEAQNIFQRYRLCRLSWISHRNDFCSFLSTSHPDAYYEDFGFKWSFNSGEEMKNTFQDGGQLGFPIRMILAVLIY